MEEISLREVVEILLRQKKIIAIVTIVCIIIGFIAVFTRTRTYEATLTLLTNPVNQNARLEMNNLSSMINTLNDPFPQMDVITYQEQFLNPFVLAETIDELGLVDSSGQPITRTALRNMVTVSVPTNTNLLVVRVQNSDPELAADIANSMGRHFMEFITKTNRETAQILSVSLEENLQIEAQKLDEKAQNVREYLTEAGNIDALKSEIGSLVNQVTRYKENLNDTRNNILIYRNSLATLLGDGDTLSGLNINDIDIALGSSRVDYSVNVNAQNQLQNALLTIEVTELETELIRALETEQVLSEKIVELESRLSELQSNLADEEYVFNSIMRDYTLALDTYSAYQTRAKEVLIASVAELGRVSIQVSSEAPIPTVTTGTSSSVMLVIAGFLGVMAGVFIALFKEYWERTGNATA